MSKQKWSVGDLFVVTTPDGKLVVGQIVGQEQSVLNSVSLAFFDTRFDSMDEAGVASIGPETAFAVLFTSRDLLDSGDWKVVGHRHPVIPQAMRPYEHLRKGGFIGANVIGSGNVQKFLNAFYGLSPWDGWKDPQYLDRLLISPTKKPLKLLYKRR
jgi:hypothetical protein